ncbi:MAG: hypothetical protein HPY80_00340 [Bacteroidales bacterium]|nr:hypothetical protein [Bacteroidales bacterium]
MFITKLKSIFTKRVTINFIGYIIYNPKVDRWYAGLTASGKWLTTSHKNEAYVFASKQDAEIFKKYLNAYSWRGWDVIENDKQSIIKLSFSLFKPIKLTIK